jgi:hypothetical protein
VKVSLILLMFGALLPGLSAGAQVYRCDDPSGFPRFQQVPCAGDGEPVDLPPPAANWDALRPGERAMLEQRRRPRPAGRPEPRQVRDERASERSCWQKRQRLEAVSAKLRRGYRAAEGERLRRRRDALSGFIRRYCD